MACRDRRNLGEYGKKYEKICLHAVCLYAALLHLSNKPPTQIFLSELFLSVFNCSSHFCLLILTNLFIFVGSLRAHFQTQINLLRRSWTDCQFAMLWLDCRILDSLSYYMEIAIFWIYDHVWWILSINLLTWHVKVAVLFSSRKRALLLHFGFPAEKRKPEEFIRVFIWYSVDTTDLITIHICN